MTAGHLGLVEAVDHLLDKGVVVTGDAMVSLAGVDLVYLRLSLLLSSVQKLREGGALTSRREHLPHEGKAPQSTTPEQPSSGLSPSLQQTPGIAAEALLVATENPGGAPDAARDLAHLVLTLVDLLRRVLERQALHRMDGDGLPDEDVERMGSALMELDARMTELCSAFGLSRDELDIDLGPLGKIIS